MKRLTKTKLILLLTIITFLSGINKASAITCQYKLPFPGVDGNGNVVDVDDFCTYGTGSSTTDGCSVSASIDSSRSSYRCEGYGSVKENKKKYSYNQILNKWGVKDDPIVLYGYDYDVGTNYDCTNYDCLTNADGLYLKSSDTVCPKYLVVRNGNDKNVWLKSLLDTNTEDCYGAMWSTSNHYFYYNGINNHSFTSLQSAVEKLEGKIHESDANKYYSTADFEAKMYKTSDSESDFKNFLNNFSKDAASYTDVFVPLYGSSNDKDKNSEDSKNINENTEIYRTVVGNSWKSALEGYEKKLKNSCGDNWYERINIKNYGFSNSKDFISYGRPTISALNMIGKSYNLLNSYDNDISAQCWDARSEYLNKAKSFVTFMGAIGANVDGAANDDEPYYRSFTSQSYNEQAATNWKYMDWWYTALRKGVDGPLEEFKASERVEKKSVSELAVSKCWSEYYSMSTGHAPTDTLNAKKAECEALQAADEALAAENRYSFAALNVNDLHVNWNFAKYTPKCSDVVIFTDIWQAMRIIAPFLLIIFGSLDYFKAVIASDMEAMKKAKSKFPKRLIAFLLLIIVPSIISIIMKAGTNGAENTTYFKCIVTGDKGDGE